jgi:hypothetical protein
MFAASKTGRAVAAGAATDPYFNQTVLLLNDTGTNGAQNNTFVDSSTNNFTITRNGNATQGSVNPYEPTGYWSGSFTRASTQYIYAANNAAFQLGSGNFTIEGWAFFSSLPTSGNLYSMLGLWDGTPYTQFSYLTSLYNNSGTYQLTFWYSSNGSSTPNITANWTPSLNTWYHLAFVRSSNSLYIFVNGTQVGSTGSLTASLFASTQPLRIGIASNTEHAFDGNLSNVRLVKGTALYTSNFTAPTTPLTAVSGTSLLCLQNNRFIDNSSNNFTITATGAPPITSFSPFAPTASYSGATYGGTMYLDGLNDYIDTSTTSFTLGSGDFTVEFWIYFTLFTSGTAGGGPGIIDNRFGTIGASFVIYADTTGGSFQVFLNGGNRIAFTVPYTNQWYHMAVCKSSGTTKFYLNGVQQGSNYTDTNTYSSSKLRIGANLNNDFSPYAYISNFRIVTGTAVYTSAFTPPTTPLTAITNTYLLLNATNAGIYDATALNDMETVGNAQVSTTQYKWGASSMSFDGTGDWLLFPNNVNITLNQAVFTIEGWIYLNAVGSARGIVGKGTGTTGWLLSINSSNQVVFTDTTTAITSTGTLSVSTWYHIAVVRATTGTNQTKIYINGTNDGTGTSATNFNQTNSLYVGANRTGGSAFNGYMEDLRITKGVARYTANFTAPTAAFPTR